MDTTRPGPAVADGSAIAAAPIATDIDPADIAATDVATTDVDEATWRAIVEAIVGEGGPAADPAVDAPTLETRLAAVPGPTLAATLSRVDPSTLSRDDALTYLQATERAMAWLGDRQADALVAIAGRRHRVSTHAVVSSAEVTIEDESRSEIAAAARWSESWSDGRLTAARLLHGPLPLTKAALSRGEITLRHADAVCDAAAQLGGFVAWIAQDVTLGFADTTTEVLDFVDQCRRLEEAVLPVARRGGISAARRSATRALARIDAEHAARRRRAARQRRDVTIVDEGDGHATLTAYLGLEQAHACLAAVDLLARDSAWRATGVDVCGPDSVTSAPQPDASIGEWRVEALVRLLLGAGAVGRAGTPIRAHVDIAIDLAALLGLADDPATMRSGGPGGPVHLAAQVVRELVAADPDSTMRRLVTDPVTGHLLDRGRSSYRIPDSLRDFIVTRDRTCRFPGCNRRADLGQLDHALPWGDGGATGRANLGAICVRHHQLKTHAGWAITDSAADGSCTWISPSGRRYHHEPPEHHAPHERHQPPQHHAPHERHEPPADPEPGVEPD